MGKIPYILYMDFVKDYEGEKKKWLKNWKKAQEGCRTTGINEAFAYVTEQEQLLQKCKSRTTLKNLESAAWAAPRLENSNFLLQDLRDLQPLLGITG